MRIHLDLEANALLIQFRKKKSVKTKEIDENTIMDLDENNNPIAIEMLNVVPRIPIEQLSKLDANIPIEIHTAK